MEREGDAPAHPDLGGVPADRSTPRDESSTQIDPDNRLLAHFPLRRLDAEAIRDAMLAISGELDPRAGGPYVPSKRTAEGVVEIAENADGAHRRSVYLQQRRTQVVTLPAAVRCALHRDDLRQALALDGAAAVARRCSTRSSPGAARKAFAARLAQRGRRRHREATRLWRSASPAGRPPLANERTACEKFLTKQRDVYAKDKDADDRAWADLCQMLLASNAFLYVE